MLKYTLIIIMLLATNEISYSYQDNDNGFSITLPKGWKTSKVGFNISQGLSVSPINKAATLIIATDPLVLDNNERVLFQKNYSSSSEVFADFALNYTSTIIEPFANEICDGDVKVINDPEIIKINKMNCFKSTYACNTSTVVFTMYTFYGNNKLYALVAVYALRDLVNINKITKCINTFNIINYTQ